jgi:hypothetical protein
MLQIVITIVFLAIVGFFSVKAIKYFFPELAERQEPDKAVKVMQVAPADDLQNDFYNQQPVFAANPQPRQAKRQFPTLLIFLAAVGILLYHNQDIIKKGFFTSDAEQKPDYELLAALHAPEIDGIKVIGQTNVDGVNWFEISGKAANGELINGWFSEFALKKEPAKESKGIDAVSKKLGLPTVKERMEYIKKLKKINSALGTALQKGKPQKTD